MRPVTALLTVGLFLTNPAAASDGACVDESTVNLDPIYIWTDGVSAVEVWQEGNNVAGLQRSGCQDDNGRDVAADSKLL